MDKEIKLMAALACMMAMQPCGKADMTRPLAKRCGNCVYCPNMPKTFCKKAKRSVTKQTLANSCDYFEQ